MMVDFRVVPPEAVEFIKVTAVGGFVTTATLIINLNFRAFTKVFHSKTRKLWWLFLLLMIFPLLVIIYIFSLLFGDQPFFVAS